MARDITKVTMLVTQKGAPDGFTIIRYDKGETYELPPHLAKVFLAMGWATPAAEAKMLAPAYENKMEAAPAPSVKGAEDVEKVQHAGADEKAGKEEVKTRAPRKA